jgi:hypothetical protein
MFRLVLTSDAGADLRGHEFEGDEVSGETSHRVVKALDSAKRLRDASLV